jgi:hypothetical protein
VVRSDQEESRCVPDTRHARLKRSRGRDDVQLGSRAAPDLASVHTDRHQRPNPCGLDYTYSYGALAFGQELWQHFLISERQRQLSAEELDEVLKADVKLAELDLYADLAALWETETVPGLREHHAAWYRRLLGVHPAKRAAFRDGLLRIQAGGGMPVEDLAHLIDHS